MKVLINILIISALTTKSVYSQSNETIEVNSVVKLNFLYPGISYEQKVSGIKTIYFAGDVDFFIATKKYYDGKQAYLFSGPAIDIEFRNYYNFKTRSQKNKQTSMNSANYIAPVYIGTYVTSNPDNTKELRLAQQIGVVWGMQRNYSKRFSFDINGGVGYLFAAKDIHKQLLPVLKLHIGFWLNRKSNRNP